MSRVENLIALSEQPVTVTIPTGLLLAGIQKDLASPADRTRAFTVIRDEWPVLAPFRDAILGWLDSARYASWHSRTPVEEVMAWIESQP